MKVFLLRILSLLVTLFLLTGCQKDTSNSFSETTNATFEEFTNQLFLEEITSNTLQMHYSIEDPAAFGIHDYKISLGNFSQETREASSTYLNETLTKVLSFDTSMLSLENQLTHDILVDSLNSQLSLSKYDLYREPLSPSGGLHMELPILFAEYAFHREQDVKDYLKLIALADEYFDQLMTFEAEKSNNGLFMSSSMCQLIIDSCKDFLLNKEHHYLITSFASRINDLNISEQKKASYIRQNNTILEKQLFPAYEKMILTLETLKNTGKNSLGLFYFDKGKSYYEHLVYAETGCSDSMDLLFRRIENQRLQDLLVCSQLQEKEPDIVSNCSNLEWNMKNPSVMLDQLQISILEEFPEPPDCEYEINYVEPALEEYLAPAFYIVAPMDHYTENVIYINDGYISSDIYAFTTLAHEGYPGHLYQTVMTYTYHLPRIRSILNYSGYVEGWATYTEMMAYGYAGLQEGLASFLSHNQAAILSLYASSDIGLHYYGWTLEELKEFWAGHGIVNEDAILQISQHILSRPSNYLKYYVGYLEFLELKEYAKELFGTQYSDKQFHQAILDIGPAPFSLLKEYLPKYY